MKKIPLLALVCALSLLSFSEALAVIGTPAGFDEQLLKFYKKRQASFNDEESIETKVEDGSDEVKAEIVQYRTLPDNGSILICLPEELRWRVLEFLYLNDLGRLALANTRMLASVRSFLEYGLVAENTPHAARMIPWCSRYLVVRGLLALDEINEEQRENAADFVERLAAAIETAYVTNQYDVVVQFYLAYLGLVGERLKLKHVVDMFPRLDRGDPGALMLFVTTCLHDGRFTQDAILNVLYYLLPIAFEKKDARVSPLIIPSIVQLILDAMGEDNLAQRKFFNQLIKLMHGAMKKNPFAVIVCLGRIPWLREHINDSIAFPKYDMPGITPLGLAVLEGASLEVVIALMEAGANADAEMMVDIEGSWGVPAVTTAWMATAVLASFHPIAIERVDGAPRTLRLTTTIRRCLAARRGLSELMPQYLEVFERFDLLRRLDDDSDSLVLNNDDIGYVGSDSDEEDVEVKNEIPIELDDDDDDGEPVRLPMQQHLDFEAGVFNPGGNTLEEWIRGLLLALASFAIQKHSH